MTKTLIAITALALFGLAPAANADVDRVAGGWDLSGSHVIEFTCTSGCSGTFPHTMNVTAMDLGTGDFSGDGHYNPNPAFTWDVDGNVSGSALSFHVVYTGLNPGYTVDAVGTIAEDGSLSGTAVSSANQTFDWVSTSGGATRSFEGSHGQYVKSQDDKQAAAQSRIGMPTHSKGHTK